MQLHILGFNRGAEAPVGQSAFACKDDGQRYGALPQVTPNRLAELLLGRGEVQDIVENLEREPEVLTVDAQSLNTIGIEADQQASAFARQHKQRGRLAADG